MPDLNADKDNEEEEILEESELELLNSLRNGDEEDIQNI